MMRQQYLGRQSHRLAGLMVILPAIICVALLSSALGQSIHPDLSRPQAAAEESAEVVPVSLALKIVVDEATDRWAKFAVGNPVLCSDDNGKLVAYMVPVRLNNDVFPTDREVVLSHGQSAEASGFDWGADDYWTFVVSARERDFPIPCEFNTLPPFFVTAAQARDIAARELQTTDVTLTRHYFLGHRGEYFEFAGADKMVLIDAYRLNVCDSPRILSRKGEVTGALTQLRPEDSERRLRREAYAQQVRDEWKRLKERAAKGTGPR